MTKTKEQNQLEDFSVYLTVPPKQFDHENPVGPKRVSLARPRLMALALPWAGRESLLLQEPDTGAAVCVCVCVCGFRTARFLYTTRRSGRVADYLYIHFLAKNKTHPPCPIL